MTSQDLKASILLLAVQGKLVPQNLSDEPVSELLKRIKAEKERLIKEGKVTIDKKHTASPITEDDIPYDLPETWRWVKFADIVTFYSGKTPERHTASYWSDGEYTWVSIADMVSDGITVETKERITHEALSDCFSDRVSPAGTMIMSFKLTIGKVSILGVDAVHNEAIISIFPFLEDSALKGYLFKILPLIASGGDSKNAIKGKTLNATSLSNLMIPLPPLAEQRRIVAKIEELMPWVEEYGKAEERLTAVNAEFPDKLRKSVLQQAIQGKLTERNPADEPASELLKRIRTEKEQLIKEGKIKKEKPLPPITEEEYPFEIPDGWKWIRFSDIATFENGDRSSRYPVEQDYVEYGIPFFGAKDMSEKYMSFANVRYISQKKFEELGNGKLQDKDFVCLLRGSVGKCAVFCSDNNHKTGFICAQMIIIRLIDKTLCDYIYDYLSSPYYAKWIESKVTGTAVKQLPGKELGQVLIPLPPFAEQQRIVDRVNELLAVCNELK